MDSIRRFIHKTGFAKGVEYIEYHPDGRKIKVYKDGHEELSPDMIDLSSAEGWVKRGYWLEVEVRDINKEQSMGL